MLQFPTEIRLACHECHSVTVHRILSVDENELAVACTGCGEEKKHAMKQANMRAMPPPLVVEETPEETPIKGRWGKKPGRKT